MPVVEFPGQRASASRAVRREPATELSAGQILADLEDGVIVTTLDGRISSWFRGSEEIFGYNALQTAGHRIEEFVAPAHRAAFRAAMSAAVDGRETWKPEWNMRRQTGAAFRGELQMTVHRDAAGRPRAIVFCCREINRREARDRDETQLARALGIADAVIMVLDHRGRAIFLNDAARALCGCSAEELRRKPLWSTLAPRGNRRKQQECFVRVRDGGRAESIRAQWQCRGLGLRTIEWALSPMPASDSQDGPCIVGVALDITDRQLAESALEQSEGELRMLAENVPSLFSYVDAEQRYRFVNNKYEELFRRPSEEIIGSRVRDLIGASNYELLQPHIDAALKGQRTDFEVELNIAGAGRRHMEITVVPDHSAAGEVTGFFTLAHDITPRKKAESDLRVSQRKLKDLTARLINAQEQERRRIAAELHDDLNQKLAALAISFSKLKRLAASAPSEAEREIDRLQHEVIALSDDVRHLSRRLHPAVLEHVGLVAALKAYCTEFSERESIPVEFETRDAPNAISDEIALCLYRVGQEALRNVAKHSGAKRATVQLAGEPRGIHLRITDCGVGFDLNALNESFGLGLVTMEERVRLVGGRYTIESRQGKGTSIDVRVPL